MVIASTITLTTDMPAEGKSQSLQPSDSLESMKMMEWGKYDSLSKRRFGFFCLSLILPFASRNMANCVPDRADKYLQTLERLIGSAPPPQQNYPFGTKLSQTILITHYFQTPTGCAQRDDDGTDNDNNDVYIGEDDTAGDNYAANGSDANLSSNIIPRKDMNGNDGNKANGSASSNNRHDSLPKPWPPEHSSFLNSSSVQEHLALEIASGGGVSQRPKEVQKGNVRVVIPGSLRERGEFCLVDMSLVELAVKKNMTAAASSASTPTSATKKKSTFAWRVRSVEFHSMERLP
jgi:hypothetical protein